MSDSTIPKTVIIGETSTIGKALLAAHRRIDPTTLSTNRTTLDLEKPNIARLKLAKNGVKNALIFAACSKVDFCQNNSAFSRKINVDGTLELARQLYDEGVKPIWASSDYVFEGIKGGNADDAPKNPSTEYGRQKSEAEDRLLLLTKGNCLILRISKVFSIEKNGVLLDEMAKAIVTRKNFRAAYDQVFAPTLLDDLTRLTLELQRKNALGIFNACGPELWSRYDLAMALAHALNVAEPMIEKITLDDLNEGFSRPKRTEPVNLRLQRELPKFHFTPVEDALQTFAINVST